jgi:hypothetical protein
MKRSTRAPGSACTTSGETPAAKAARLAASSLKRMMPWTGMSSATRTTKRSPRSATTKLRLVMPPVSGSGSTGPDQKLKPAALAVAASALMKLSYSRPSSRFLRRLQAEISRSEIIAMKATQAPATRPRPVSALVSAI